MHLISIIVCMCMCSSDVEWYRGVERAQRDRLMAIPAPGGWDLSRMVVNLSIHFLPHPCIECRLLGQAATPPRPLVLLSPPLVADFSDRYKKSNRKHNYYSMSMISTHTNIQTYIQHTYNRSRKKRIIETTEKSYSKLHTIIDQFSRSKQKLQ